MMLMCSLIRLPVVVDTGRIEAIINIPYISAEAQDAAARICASGRPSVNPTFVRKLRYLD